MVYPSSEGWPWTDERVQNHPRQKATPAEIPRTLTIPFRGKLGLSGGNDGGLSNVLLILVFIVVGFDREGDDVSRMAAVGEKVVVSAAQLRARL